MLADDFSRDAKLIGAAANGLGSLGPAHFLPPGISPSSRSQPAVPPSQQSARQQLLSERPPRQPAQLFSTVCSSRSLHSPRRPLGALPQLLLVPAPTTRRAAATTSGRLPLTAACCRPPRTAPAAPTTLFPGAPRPGRHGSAQDAGRPGAGAAECAAEPGAGRRQGRRQAAAGQGAQPHEPGWPRGEPLLHDMIEGYVDAVKLLRLSHLPTTQLHLQCRQLPLSALPLHAWLPTLPLLLRCRRAAPAHTPPRPLA